MTINYEFGSDNHSGVHPEIMREINKVNTSFSIAYGDDSETKKAKQKFREHFGKEIEVYFVGNGTAANIIGLKNVTESFNSIICPETAHLNVHECCGPEKFIGSKITTIPTKDGKLTVDMIKPYLIGFNDPHMAQPKIVSITQSTECGTTYKPDEIKKLSDFAHKNDMLLHMDGARLCNAAAYLKCKLKNITTDVGVDILSFGGTKNGMMFGDAVIFFDKKHAKNFEYYRKQGMHLTSKMRFISAQFNAMLSNNLWYENAIHANKMAKLLYNKVKDFSHVKVTQKVQANAVFAQITKDKIKKLQKKYFFHVFDENKSEVRWMCSFNTTKDEVLAFVDAIKSVN